MSWLKAFKTIDLVAQQNMWWRIGCLSAAFAVAFGAIGAHAVRDKDPYYAKTFNTSVKYHTTHSIALLLVARSLSPSIRHLSRAGILFSTGIVFFCGS